MPFEAKPVEWTPCEADGKYENSNVWKFGFVNVPEGPFEGQQKVRIMKSTEMPYVSDLRRFGLVDKQDRGKKSAAKHDEKYWGKASSASGAASSSSTDTVGWSWSGSIWADRVR
jgi:hypothetical protein